MRKSYHQDVYRAMQQLDIHPESCNSFERHLGVLGRSVSVQIPSLPTRPLKTSEASGVSEAVVKAFQNHAPKSRCDQDLVKLKKYFFPPHMLKSVKN